MADNRNWSTKTLAKQLVLFLRQHRDLEPTSSLDDVMRRLSKSIVKEEVGVDLNPWDDAETE